MAGEPAAHFGHVMQTDQSAWLPIVSQIFQHKQNKSCLHLLKSFNRMKQEYKSNVLTCLKQSIDWINANVKRSTEWSPIIIQIVTESHKQRLLLID